MKGIVSVGVSLVLALAPVAHAQVTCSEVAKVNSYGLEDFVDITGDEIDDDYYSATYKLVGADECSIDYTTDSIYSCSWFFSSYALASSAYDVHLSALASCLSGWRYEAQQTDPQAKNGYRSLKAAAYLGSGQYSDMAWGAFLEEHAFDSGTDWHVTIGLAYFW
jgi:hypothetical protein